jgi:hypothetical protein
VILVTLTGRTESHAEAMQLRVNQRWIIDTGQLAVRRTLVAAG